MVSRHHLGSYKWVILPIKSSQTGMFKQLRNTWQEDMLDSLPRLGGVCQWQQLVHEKDTPFCKLASNGIMLPPGHHPLSQGWTRCRETAILFNTSCRWHQTRRTHSECHRSWAGPAASCRVCPDQRGLTWPGSPDGTGSPAASVPFSLLCGSLLWCGACQLETLGNELAFLRCSHLPTRCLLGNHLEETEVEIIIQTTLLYLHHEKRLANITQVQSNWDISCNTIAHPCGSKGEVGEIWAKQCYCEKVLKSRICGLAVCSQREHVSC